MLKDKGNNWENECIDECWELNLYYCFEKKTLFNFKLVLMSSRCQLRFVCCFMLQERQHKNTENMKKNSTQGAGTHGVRLA